jgi:hypothetical protein
MKLKQILAIITICTLPYYSNAQKIKTPIESSTMHTKKFHIIGSAGIGFPSVLGYVLIKNEGKTVVINQSTNPFMAKLEYCRKRWGIATSFTTNFQNFDLIWPNTNPKLVDNTIFNTWNIGLRGNFYLINKSFHHKINNLSWKDQFQLYIGGGAGYLKTTQKTRTVNFNEPFIVAETYGSFPMSFEATIGSRYFLNQYIGLFIEAGLGNSPIQLIDKGISDSYVQGGLSIRF